MGLSAPPQAEGLRIATWNVGLERRGPGLLLRDITRDADPQVQAVLQIIARLDADILLLTGVDFDAGGAALTALQDRLAARDAAYPYHLALRPNTGVQTGLDLDGDGRIGGARDAQGYGRFAGAGGMALLSRLPIDPAGVQDFSTFLWRDLPGALLPPGMTKADRASQRLSSTGHWLVSVTLPSGQPISLLAFHATPPVFDGPEDRNGRRNHDEAAFWRLFLQGALPFAPPKGPVVLLGDANLDPVNGHGRPAALRALLAGPPLQDPRPRGSAGRRDDGQRGDAALDTALYDPPLGGLRLDYVLPDARLSVIGAGVLWPGPDDALARTLQTASRHYPVWVDLDLPGQPAPTAP